MGLEYGLSLNLIIIKAVPVILCVILHYVDVAGMTFVRSQRALHDPPKNKKCMLLVGLYLCMAL